MLKFCKTRTFSNLKCKYKRNNPKFGAKIIVELLSKMAVLFPNCCRK